MRAMNMLGKAEEKVCNTLFSRAQAMDNTSIVFNSVYTSFFSIQFNDLVKKKQIVENDKMKIAELITELDHKKNEALQGAYERVNTVCMKL